MPNTTSKPTTPAGLMLELCLLTTLAFFNSMAAVAESFPTEILGDWEMTVNTQMGANRVTLNITEAEGGLHIVWDSALSRGEAKQADEVRWDEGELKFNIPVTVMMNGDRIQAKINYVISFEANELSGREITPLGIAHFSGNRIAAH